MSPHNQLGNTGGIQKQLPIRKAQIHNSVKKPKADTFYEPIQQYLINCVISNSTILKLFKEHLSVH